MIDELVALAEKQVGVREQPDGSNNVIYNTDYYGAPVSGGAYPWCCAFIWWLFAQLHALEMFCGGEKTAYCPYVVNYAKQHRQWVTDGFRRGDLVLFDWDGDKVADHIGLVTGASLSSVYTIEGNVDNAVRKMERSCVTILGAYRPDYSGKSDVKPSPAEHLYTVQKGDSLWKIAEKTLGKGEYYFQIKQANNMTSDMIYPGQVLIIPHSDDGEITLSVTIKDETYARLKIMAEGQGKTVGQVIDALLEDEG